MQFARSKLLVVLAIMSHKQGSSLFFFLIFKKIFFILQIFIVQVCLQV